MNRIQRLLLLLDGLSDRPHPALKDRTPLQAAKLPVLDKLAREGLCGVADPLPNGEIATTVQGSLAVLGYKPEDLRISRGVIEALGCDAKLNGEDVALRGNWACLDANGFLKDRRAGRIRKNREELVGVLENIREWNDNIVDVYLGTEHRTAIVLRGPGLSNRISGSDPGDHHPEHIPPRVPQPLDQKDPRSRKTAILLQRFEQSARTLLADHPVNLERAKNGLFPANALISREAGKLPDRLPDIKSPHLAGTIISGEKTLNGIARMIGMDFHTLPSMTGSLDTDLAGKFQQTGEMLEKKDLVLLHIKGTDIASHNCDPEAKKNFLMRIDTELGRFLEARDSQLRFAVTSDHCTSSITGTHLNDPVPVVLWGTGIEKDGVEGFDEKQLKQGGLGRFSLSDVWEKLMN